MTIQIIESGTREGALKAWDKRGRGRKKNLEEAQYYEMGAIEFEKSPTQISNTEREVILAWTGSDWYPFVQESLRNEKPKLDYQDDIQTLDNLIKKQPESELSFVFYRRTGVFGSAFKRGEIYEDKGFVSTSIKDPKNYYAYWGGKKTLWKIKVPKGSKFFKVYVDTRHSPLEQEVLLPRNSRFKILDVRKYDGETEIVAEYLGS